MDIENQTAPLLVLGKGLNQLKTFLYATNVEIQDNPQVFTEEDVFKLSEASTVMLNAISELEFRIAMCPLKEANPSQANVLDAIREAVNGMGINLVDMSQQFDAAEESELCDCPACRNERASEKTGQKMH